MAAAATDLRVDYIDRPVGLENRRPRFSWAIESGGRDVRQAAYRIQVSEDAAGLDAGPWVWDSGRVASSRSVDTPYDGPTLASRERRAWRVSVWLGEGAEPVASEASWWEMGLLDSADWRADWIAAPMPPDGDPGQPGPAALLRRGFVTDARPVAARLYATALGAYEAHINGRKVGDAILAPESTDFRRRLLYQTYDVTDLVRAGDNVLGVVLADGWYSSAFAWKNLRNTFGPPPNRFCAQLELTFVDGRREIVTTDPAWRAARSAIVSAEIYDGEAYDARLELPGWCDPSFDASGWTPAARVEGPQIAWAAQVSPPIRAMERLKAVAVTQSSPGIWVYDFGQNFAGWVRLTARGPAGTTIRLRFAEILADDGAISTENLRGAKATDTFILRGEGVERFEPRFTYHGFRFVEMTGYPGVPTADALEGVAAYSDCPITGALETSNPLIDKIWRNSVWSQKSNFFGVPTDCPQRDERLGWMGDAQVYWDAASYTMDVDAFTRRFLGDVRAAQRRTGGFPDVTPFETRWDGAPGWGDAGVILPWTLWRKFGDTGVIDESWDSMVRWLDWIAANNPDCVWRNRRGVDYGDWLAPDAVKPGDPTTPKDLIGTAFWAYDAALMAQMAKASGRPAEARAYGELRARIGQAFVQDFVRPDGSVGNDSQTSHALALRFGLVPDSLRAASAGRLAADVAARGGHLSTGFLGTPYILDALADNGFEDVAVGLLLQTSFPSWGYMVERGATTMWERWNGDTGDVAMNSFNHYAYGAVTGFLYRRLAAIAPAAPGFEQVEVRPLNDARTPDGGGTYRSVRGPIRTSWRRGADGTFSLDLTLPANVGATVHLPAAPGRRMLEGGGPFEGAARREAAGWIAEVGSGTYSFSVE